MAFAVTQAMLDEAQSAYHSLMLGQSVAQFRDQNGEMVSYSRADSSKLALYIERLKKDLGLTPVSVAPMRFWL